MEVITPAIVDVAAMSGDRKNVSNYLITTFLPFTM